MVDVTLTSRGFERMTLGNESKASCSRTAWHHASDTRLGAIGGACGEEICERRRFYGSLVVLLVSGALVAALFLATVPASARGQATTPRPDTKPDLNGI